MRFNQMKTVVMMLFGLAILPACETVNTVERKESRARPNRVALNKVTTDTTLNLKARVLEVREANVNGFLKVQVEIQNKLHNVHRFNYKFEWIDESGIIIDSVLSSWKQAAMPGKESIMITALAPTKRAVDFKLKLVEPQD